MGEKQAWAHKCVRRCNLMNVQLRRITIWVLTVLPANNTTGLIAFVSAGADTDTVTGVPGVNDDVFGGVIVIVAPVNPRAASNCWPRVSASSLVKPTVVAIFAVS